eukprot:COSAG02_NODE_25598_length_653_cov_6.023936_2_plen_80_part_01
MMSMSCGFFSAMREKVSKSFEFEKSLEASRIRCSVTVFTHQFPMPRTFQSKVELRQPQNVKSGRIKQQIRTTVQSTRNVR